MRGGERHDLAGVAGIGEDLLVAGHAGIEADLSCGDPGSADRPAAEHGAVGEEEEGFGALTYKHSCEGCRAFSRRA